MSIKTTIRKMMPAKLKALLKIPYVIHLNPWCDKARSFALSKKYKCLFIVGPHTNVVIEDGAKININGQFIYNKPWYGRQIIPANLYISSSGTLNVLDEFVFYSGCEVTVGKNATLTLGNGYMNMHGNIMCCNLISIGHQTIIGDDVNIRDSNSHTIEREDYSDNNPIIIGDYVWIGMRTTILQGVTIGNGAVIGACSLVNKSVPSKTLYAGVPAKCIREGVEWK